MMISTLHYDLFYIGDMAILSYVVDGNQANGPHGIPINRPPVIPSECSCPGPNL